LIEFRELLRINGKGSIINFTCMNMKYLTYFLLALLIAILTSDWLFAQPSLPDAPDQAPIDGGLGILAAAGGAYALKKIRDRKKAEDIDTDL